MRRRGGIAWVEKMRLSCFSWKEAEVRKLSQVEHLDIRDVRRNFQRHFTSQWSVQVEIPEQRLTVVGDDVLSKAISIEIRECRSFRGKNCRFSDGEWTSWSWLIISCSCRLVLRHLARSAKWFSIIPPLSVSISLRKRDNHAGVHYENWFWEIPVGHGEVPQGKGMGAKAMSRGLRFYFITD